jgi:hypothetical protein
MRLERPVYRHAVCGKYDRVSGKGGHDLPDWGEATGALAPSRDVTATVGEARYRWGQAVQDDGAAFESR